METWDKVACIRKSNHVGAAGSGLAVSLDLGLMVTSTFSNTLSIWRLPERFALAEVPTPMELLGTLGGSLSPMIFNFDHGSNCLAFFVPPWGSYPLLLVADFYNGAVHIVDVVSRDHKGYVF